MKPCTKALLLALLLCFIPLSRPSQAQTATFDSAATSALEAMRTRAQALHTEGVALLAYFPGDTFQSWTSKALVVGSIKHEPTAASKGDNLLAIAYAKAAEMADTLKDSGSQTRPPLTGEFGWQGGVIARVPGGYLIAAFSGGKSEDDVAISHAGLTELQQQMKLTTR